MIIDGDWKNKVRAMRSSGDNEGAKRELRKAKMSKSYRKTNDKNRIFIDYCLALHSIEEENMELTKNYLCDIEKIFLEDKLKITELNIEYCNYLWLKTNVNSEVMTLENIEKNMMYVCNYYHSIEKYDLAIGALANIYSLKGDGKLLLEKLEEFMMCPQISDKKFIEDFLDDCDKISHDLYIEALGIINKYDTKNNIDVV